MSSDCYVMKLQMKMVKILKCQEAVVEVIFSTKHYLQDLLDYSFALQILYFESEIWVEICSQELVVVSLTSR